MKIKFLYFIRFFALLFLLQVQAKTCLNFGSGGLQNHLQAVGLGWDLVLDGQTTIAKGGLYRLAQNTTGNIVISASDVLLDLQGATLTGETSTDPVITIDPSLENIKIINGVIKGQGPDATVDGIFAGAANQLITLKDLIIFDARNGIVLFDPTNVSMIKSCKLENIKLQNCTVGVLLQGTKKTTLKNCTASNCINAGFTQGFSQFNVYDKCYALETMNNDSVRDAIGFESVAGQGNLYSECVSEGTTKSAGVYTTNNARAIGFHLSTFGGVVERDTKIINSIANTTLVATSSSIAYGIMLDSILLTGTNLADDLVASYTHGASINSVDWSPDDKYLAIAGSSGSGVGTPEVRVLKFEDGSLSTIASYDHGALNIYLISWSPDGKYLAIGGSAGTGGYEVRVLRFDGSSLIELAGCNYIHGNNIFSVDWSPCGKYLAIGGLAGTNANGTADVRILKFDGIGLQFVTNLFPIHGADVNSVNWSPDGKYLAIGGAAGTGTYQVRVLKFDGSNLTILSGCNYAHGLDIFEVNWSPDGKYLAICGGSSAYPAVGYEVRVLRFDGLSLTPISGCNYSHGTADTLIYSVDWSPEGKYLAIGGISSNAPAFGGYDVRILLFDGSALSVVKSYSHALINQLISSVDWSPDSLNLAIGGLVGIGGYQVRVFDVMDAPAGCLLQSNKVCNATSSYDLASGTISRQAIGICASGQNLYVKNVGSYNDINFNPAIYNVYGASLLSCNPYEFDNLWQPPYEAAYGWMGTCTCSC